MCSGGVLARTWRGSRASRVSGVRHDFSLILARFEVWSLDCEAWGSGSRDGRVLRRCVAVVVPYEA